MLFLENKSGGVRVLNIPIFSLLLQIKKNTERHTPERESVCSCSVASNSFVTLWTLAHQAPLSMGFSRQEYWSGLPGPPPGDLPDPGAPSLALQAFFTAEPLGKPARV